MDQQREQDDRRELYGGTANGWQRAFELAVTPLLIGGLGWWLDGLLGISPILTILFGVVGAVGTVVKIYYQYKAEMEAHDLDAPWGHRPGKATG